MSRAFLLGSIGLSPRVAVFLSGRGSTAQALFEVPSLRVELVVSNRKKALGVLKAKRFGIPTLYFSKLMDWDILSQELKARRVQWIFMCGFMKILPSEFVDQWAHQIVNIHPSLLPLYAGAHGVEDSFFSDGPYGVSVHEATEKMDEGPFYFQKRIPRQDVGQDLEVLKSKITQAEQDLLRRWSWHFGNQLRRRVV